MYRRISHSLWAYFGILLICCTGARAQTIICSGKVSDSSGAPLPYANILAHPRVEKDPVFAIADEHGSYNITLLANTTYTIRVGYLGYAPKSLTVTTGKKNITQDLLLLPDTAMLEEVVVNADIPVLVKEDTLIYQTAAFSSGKERKLGELLRKLPGVEVDKAGKIMVGGKEVKKVMVENQPFFTGESRLAVDHIPADAVAQVEMLDNYNELSLLKGLRDSDEMAMNIRLKADKKNFAFGDIDLGGGLEDRYSLRPGIFYYSPLTTVNMIGDINNEGRNAFTLEDYMAFEGGYTNLLKEQSGFNEHFADDLAGFLSDKDIKESDQQFGALNVRHKISPKTELNTYALLAGEKKSTQIETWNEYSTGLDVLNETRFQNSEQDNFFLMGKIRLDHSPSANEQLTANSYIKLAGNTLGEDISTTAPFLQQITQRSQLESLRFKQHVRYSKKLHSKHTLLAELSFGHRKNSPEAHWTAGHPLLEHLFPLTGRSISGIAQDQELSSSSAGFLLKDYWQVNPRNHLYFSAGFTFSGELFRSRTNSGSHRLPLAVNRLRYQKQDAFAGLEYKVKLGKFTLKPALFYHYYNWDAAQPAKKYHRHKSWLQPEFTVEAKLGRTAQMRFRYSMDTQLPLVRQLAAHPVVQAFNQVSQGTPELENAYYHSFSINYSSIRLPGTFFSAGLSWQRKVRNIKESILLYLPGRASSARQGYLDQFSSFIMLNRPENSLMARLAWSKKINRIRYTLKGNYMHNGFFQVINDQALKNRSRSMLGTAKAGTSFKHFPDLSIGYTVHLIVTEQLTPETILAVMSSSGSSALFSWKIFSSRWIIPGFTIKHRRHSANNLKWPTHLFIIKPPKAPGVLNYVFRIY